MIEAFLFDLGNVLLHFSHDRMCAQIAAACGMEAHDVRRWLFDDGLEQRYESGQVSSHELVGFLEEKAGRRVDIEELSRAASDIFWPVEAMEELVRGLRAQGHRLVLLSNINELHHRWIRERYTVLDSFAALTLSYEVGACKPNAAIFEAAVRNACVPAERCFYTDDIPAYVEAARQMGIDAVVFRGVDALLRELEQRNVGIEGMDVSPV